MTLITSPTFTTNTGRHTLPGLFAAMARGEVQSFAALRPHQRPAWHMFLVQLAALGLWRADLADPPPDEGAWRTLMLTLTSGEETAWALVGPEDRPAFLQPAVVPDLKWSRVETPDALDMLITSRNHDLKQQVAHAAEPQDWVYALVSLQTGEGYGGAGNQGILRMNGGSSSRPMLGFAPAFPNGGGPDPSAWWRRDVHRLLALRQAGRGLDYGTGDGPALLWTLPWPEGRQLALAELDPWFIEVCRRIRLTRESDRLVALRTTSARARINADGVNGVTGDAWAPVTMDKSPRSLTLSGGSFDYERICELLFSANWQRPALAEPAEREGDLLLVAEAFSRGNSKTEGFKSRIVPVPGWARGLLTPEGAGTLAKAQMEEIKVFSGALRFSLGLVVAGGDGEKHKGLRKTDGGKRRIDAAASIPVSRFTREADALFFPALWTRLRAAAEDRQAVADGFIAQLHGTAQAVFDAALPTVPCPSILRPRAEARARRAFVSTVWKGLGGGRDFSFLFAKKESADAPA